MAQNTLKQRLALVLDQDTKTIDTLLNAFRETFYNNVSKNNSLSIPSFGSFTPVKYNEEIRKKVSSGEDMLFPPKIVIEFIPATSLKKKILK